LNAGISIGKALQQGRLRLAACSETPGLDAQRLLVSVTGRPRAWLLSHPEAALDRQQEQSFRQGLERLLEGEALAYVLGEWPFYGRDFAISPHVLIPRPETELLVEAALDYLRVHPSRRLAADIGAGSGCIGVSLAAEVPDLIVVATEISPVAAKLAYENARRHGVEGRLHLVVGDLLAPIAARFDLICANLPYIPSDRLAILEVARREPRLALDGGRQGVELILRLIPQLAARLTPGGLVLFEIDPGLEGSLIQEVSRCLPGSQVEIRPDLAGHPRMLLIRNLD